MRSGTKWRAGRAGPMACTVRWSRGWRTERKAEGMRYLVLVSHGTLAQGVHSVLKMLMGENPLVLSTSLEDGMGADAFTERFRETVSVVGEGDEVVLLGDIVGGSPLTLSMNVLQERGLLSSAIVFGGMSLPMAIAALMKLDAEDPADIRVEIANEGRAGVRELEVSGTDEDEDEDL